MKESLRELIYKTPNFLGDRRATPEKRISNRIHFEVCPCGRHTSYIYRVCLHGSGRVFGICATCYSHLAAEHRISVVLSSPQVTAPMRPVKVEEMPTQLLSSVKIKAMRP